MNRHYVLYDCEPIGLAGAMEAVSVHWYCCQACQIDAAGDGQTGGLNPDAIEGTACEQCGKPLQFAQAEGSATL